MFEKKKTMAISFHLTTFTARVYLDVGFELGNPPGNKSALLVTFTLCFLTMNFL